MIEHIKIKPKEYLKTFWVVRSIAQNNRVSIFKAKRIIRNEINSAWNRAWTPGNLKAQANWQKLFPADRAPTVEEFIVTIAREMMAGRNPPYLLE